MSRNDAAAEDEEIADLKLLDEILPRPNRGGDGRSKTSTKPSETIVPILTRKSRATRGWASEMIPSSIADFSEKSGVLFLAAKRRRLPDNRECGRIRRAPDRETDRRAESIANASSIAIGASAAIPTMCCAMTSYRLFLNPDRIERRSPDEFRGDGRFHEVVDVGRDQHAVTAAIQRMTGTPNPLNGARDAFRRRHHHDEIDRADIDPQLQTGRANHRAQLAVF